eukprot:TRINITY_DN111262_c0_g1_i1.p1 TRINITY_DN111262_c0_g1~~TRINITY_DN111262_c0_g1_i1.p1  ORF type:complete len:503 (+),score=43.51 TRINITY_DN111262_c0_g1_i1:120-1628(+)
MTNESVLDAIPEAKRQKVEHTRAEQQPEAPDAQHSELAYTHRLHYHWSQLEADRCGCNIGSPSRPLPQVDRELRLSAGRVYTKVWGKDEAAKRNRFSACAGVYETIDYHTFSKNGCLKLTEVEVYFLNRWMTKTSSSEWLVVYLGVGNGERFRWVRDEFFPGLTVIAYDPLDSYFTGCREDVHANAKAWSNDGTGFTFHVRCFDCDTEVPLIKAAQGDKKLLLISDIRGINLLTPRRPDDKAFDKQKDMDIQLEGVRRLNPVSSIMKFTTPNYSDQFFDYAPGVLLKQVFCNYFCQETRLMFDGVPTTTRSYNCWEYYDKIVFHHEHMRGQVYESSSPPCPHSCFDHCFDCTLLRETFAAYAAKNSLNAENVLSSLVKHHVYAPCAEGWDGKQTRLEWNVIKPTTNMRWRDAVWSLNKGRVMDAIAALEAEGAEDDEGWDWSDIAYYMAALQPKLSQRMLSALPRPATRRDLVPFLGSLSEPFTIIRTYMNGLWEANLEHSQ